MWNILIFFAGLWPIILQESAAILIIAALLALAYFSPIWKVDFIWAAACVAVYLFAVNHGISLEHARTVAQSKEVTSEVNSVVKNSRGPVSEDPYDSIHN